MQQLQVHSCDPTTFEVVRYEVAVVEVEDTEGGAEWKHGIRYCRL